jgi:hypothetical protein
MLANLFDERRRKELQKAILGGAEIESRKRKPLAEAKLNPQQAPWGSLERQNDSPDFIAVQGYGPSDLHIDSMADPLVIPRVVKC